ncbi:hypothetical protein BDV59DRAFT_201535 [Aspergillus ambiguus]|uniref:uncharacterized protein n=1 Tax=Aspergillus ambiguus TaxID=176160 RepID=UPI003CCD6EAD
MLQKMGMSIEPSKPDVRRASQDPEFLTRGIITLKDDSTWFDIPPRTQKRLSVAGMQKEIRGDQKRRSGVRTANGRTSRSRLSVLNGVNEEDEDRRVRSSLLPFRDWVVLAQDNTIPFADEDDDSPTPPATPSPDTPRQSSFSFLTRNTDCPHRPPTPIPDELSSDSSSTASSDITITPSNVNRVREMSSGEASGQDPFTDSPMTQNRDFALPPKGGSFQGKAETGPSTQKVKSGFSSIHEEKSLPAPAQFDRNKENIINRPVVQEVHGLRLLSSNTSTRIPRGLAQKPVQAASLKGANATPETRSSIPVPVAIRRHSVDTMVSSRVTPIGSAPGGIRVLEKPHGPRPQPLEEQKTVTNQESTTKADEKDGVSSSSSSISDWDFGDDDAVQRPRDVFTGEYRTPEKLIMGPDSPGSTYAVTQRSNPALVHYPDTPTRFPGKRQVETGSSSPAAGSSSSSKKEKSPTKDTPVPRNYCRSAISLESIPKRDLSGRERAIARKPVNSPSLSSLYSPSGQSECDPLVPKVPEVPEKYSSLLKTSKSASPVTPAKSTSQLSEGSAPRSYPTPNTAGSPESVMSFPPGTSSRHRTPELATHSGPGSVIGTTATTGQTVKQKRDVTFDDIAPQSLATEQTAQAEALSKLPDSKSTRMLDSFRNIFKGRPKKEEHETSEPEHKTQTPATAIRLPKDDDKPASAKVVLKSKSRYTRLSDGVGWSKTPRDTKTPDEPASGRPSTSVSPSLAAVQPVEGQTPSFARPTKSTRTKAAVISKGQAIASSEIRVRKAHVMTGPTGSPLRPSRYRPPYVKAPSVQKNLISLPRSVGSIKSHLSSLPTKGSAALSDASDGVKNLNEILSCIETLCKRATGDDTASKRERYLRMALSLQHQFTNYRNIGKEVMEAEDLANKKRSEKCLAENLLFEHFSQVKAHLDEE